MSRRVRLIGGSHGGDTFTTDQPIIKLPCMENVDFPPPIGPSATTKDMKFDIYHVEKLNFVTGHDHRYGIIEGMRLVDAMNVLWDSYSAARRQQESNK